MDKNGNKVTGAEAEKFRVEDAWRASFDQWEREQPAAERRIAEAIRVHRSIRERIRDLGYANEVLRVCGGDETLALRWLAQPLALEAAVLLAAWGLEPEQMTRRVLVHGEERVLIGLVDDLLMILGDQERLDRVFAAASSPAPCSCGGSWLATTGSDGSEGWGCSGCGLRVRRLPQVSRPADL
jgi:hypothetical protein